MKELQTCLCDVIAKGSDPGTDGGLAGDTLKARVKQLLEKTGKPTT